MPRDRPRKRRNFNWRAELQRDERRKRASLIVLGGVVFSLMCLLAYLAFRDQSDDANANFAGGFRSGTPGHESSSGSGIIRRGFGHSGWFGG